MFCWSIFCSMTVIQDTQFEPSSDRSQVPDNAVPSSLNVPIKRPDLPVIVTFRPSRWPYTYQRLRDCRTDTLRTLLRSHRIR